MTPGKLLIFLIFFTSLFACKNTSKPEPDSSDTLKIHPGIIVKTEPKNPYAPVDISPMDMVYYPADYPQLKMAGQMKESPVMRIIYSRPHLQGRKLFTGILKHNEPWRLGANEATEFDVYRPVTIGNKKIQPGRYILYCIPGDSTWTIIVNANTDTWGLKQDTTKDIAEAVIPLTANNIPIEYFTMVFLKAPYGADLLMAWDDVLAKLPVKF